MEHITVDSFMDRFVLTVIEVRRRQVRTYLNSDWRWDIIAENYLLARVRGRNQKVVQGRVACFGRYIAWEPVHNPVLPLEYASIKILQRYRYADSACVDLTHVAVICRCTRNRPGMNQYAVASLQVRRVLLELEGEWLTRLKDSRPADCAEVLYPEF
jgi:hypothetical protein